MFDPSKLPTVEQLSKAELPALYELQKILDGFSNDLKTYSAAVNNLICVLEERARIARGPNPKGIAKIG